MALGWGEVPAGEWAGLKTRPGADVVPPGDYHVVAKKYLHFDGKDGGVNAHVIVCEVSPNNETEVGKELHIRIQYDTNPQNEGRRKMNLISLQNAKQLFEAAQVEQVLTPSGAVNVSETLKALPIKQPSFVLLVTQKDGSEYQETKNFRASPA